MKKIFIVLMLMFSLGFIKANPIAPPPIISEFYIVDASHWYLELMFSKNFPFNLTTLDGCKITTSAGTFDFKNGIHITPDSIIVITQDGLQTLLQINRSGDFILFKTSSGSYQLDQLYFGNVKGSQISSPRLGQSIVNYRHGCWTGTSFGTEYHLVKDNHPTIGYNAFSAYNISASTTTGTFTGFVYDKRHNPIAGIYIGNKFYNAPSSTCGRFFASAISGSDGRFIVPEYSGRYFVQLFYQPSMILSDSLINIEPDSLNYYEFTIDTLLTSLSLNTFKEDINLKCLPNPSSGETTISFGMSDGGNCTKALIKVYNSNGEMARILPININSSQNKYSVKWNGLCSDNSVTSGIYFCNLELDGHKVATTKIIIAK